jgi:Ni,Fe-hydrogenase III large subunit
VSRVSPAEIITLTARAFGIAKADMAEPMPRSSASPFTATGYTARCCAILLCRKHTLTGWKGISLALGMGNSQGIDRMQQAVDSFERHIARHPNIARTVEAIESAIDDLHDTRTQPRHRSIREVSP